MNTQKKNTISKQHKKTLNKLNEVINMFFLYPSDDSISSHYDLLIIQRDCLGDELESSEDLEKTYKNAELVKKSLLNLRAINYVCY